jgi:hypothetical protein
MQIVCTTAKAAGQVMSILLAAQLQPVRDYEIWPVFSTTPPITYTMLTVLKRAQRAKIRAVVDTTMVG